VTSTSAQACVSEEATFEVIQSGPAANIQSFVSGSFEEIQTITITNDGYGTYEYQLDGEGPWQSSPIFTNVPAGEHFVLVRDVTNPDYACDEMMIDDVSIINYPHFFTPNGDGINDKWNITGLGDQSNAKIYIFDRYGKLLKQISALGEGWDGTLNSQPLPATDYWFTVDYYEITIDGTLVPKQFKAHFTLKR
jgi:gliding motility-associated-like protein